MTSVDGDVEFVYRALKLAVLIGLGGSVLEKVGEQTMRFAELEEIRGADAVKRQEKNFKLKKAIALQIAHCYQRAALQATAEYEVLDDKEMSETILAMRFAKFLCHAGLRLNPMWLAVSLGECLYRYDAKSIYEQLPGQLEEKPAGLFREKKSDTIRAAVERFPLATDSRPGQKTWIRAIDEGLVDNETRRRELVLVRSRMEAVLAELRPWGAECGAQEQDLEGAIWRQFHFLVCVDCLTSLVLRLPASANQIPLPKEALRVPDFGPRGNHRPSGDQPTDKELRDLAKKIVHRVHAVRKREKVQKNRPQKDTEVRIGSRIVANLRAGERNEFLIPLHIDDELFEVIIDGESKGRRLLPSRVSQGFEHFYRFGDLSLILRIDDHGDALQLVAEPENSVLAISVEQSNWSFLKPANMLAHLTGTGVGWRLAMTGALASLVLFVGLVIPGIRESTPGQEVQIAAGSGKMGQPSIASRIAIRPSAARGKAVLYLELKRPVAAELKPLVRWEAGASSGIYVPSFVVRDGRPYLMVVLDSAALKGQSQLRVTWDDGSGDLRQVDAVSVKVESGTGLLLP